MHVPLAMAVLYIFSSKYETFNPSGSLCNLCLFPIGLRNNITFNGAGDSANPCDKLARIVAWKLRSLSTTQ